MHFPLSSPFVALDGGRAPLVAALEGDAREAEGVVADARRDVATLLEQLEVARESEAAYQESLVAELDEKKLARDEYVIDFFYPSHFVRIRLTLRLLPLTCIVVVTS